MADQSVSVSGPVQVRSDSPQRVALELAERITIYAGDEKRRPEYWFKLYAQCHRLVVSGWDPKDLSKVQ